MAVDLKDLFKKDKESYTAHEMIEKYGEAGSAFEVQKNGQKWEGREVAVKGEPLMDAGVGKEMIVRCYQIRKNPAYKDRPLTHQEIFDAFWPQMRAFLWGDGWVAIEEKEFPPKVQVLPNGDIRIFVTCIPRLGSFVADKTHTLQEYLPPKSLTNKR